MFSRLSQVTRHFSRPLPNYTHNSGAAPTVNGIAKTINMVSTTTADNRNSRMIHTAACLIIGDEVLGGKTVDTNSAYMAKWCFNLGIQLKRIETIADDKSEIVEAVRRMSASYDFVVTSGGIGPTHDDITYSSIAAAFNLPLVLHQPSFERMKRLAKPHASQPNFSWDEPSAVLTAKKRMVELPIDNSREIEGKQVLFINEELWVPITCVNGNVHILPGVPRLFENLLDGLKSVLKPRLGDQEKNRMHRILVSTPMAESAVAGYLTELQNKVEAKGVKVGSYPRWGKSTNTVTLVGKDLAFLESIVDEVVENVKGHRVVVEGENDIAGVVQGSQ